MQRLILCASSIAVCACGSTPSTPSAPGKAEPPRLEITGVAELFAPGIVSVATTEVRMTASPDGKLVLWGTNGREGGPGDDDIWVARRADPSAAWGPAEPAPFDTPSREFDPSFSPDGRWVYFFSDRPGGVGGTDLYRVAVTDAGFGAPAHLGAEINTPGDEWAPEPSPDGTQLLFASNRPGEKHDLFLAPIDGDRFGRGVPLPGAVNTPAEEFDATFLDDHSIVFSRSSDLERGPIELFFTTRGPAGYDAGTLLPPSVNVAGGATFGPSIDHHTPGVLYFTAKRPEASAGRLDIYQVRYRLTTASPRP